MFNIHDANITNRPVGTNKKDVNYLYQEERSGYQPVPKKSIYSIKAKFLVHDYAKQKVDDHNAICKHYIAYTICCNAVHKRSELDAPRFCCRRSITFCYGSAFGVSFKEDKTNEI